MYGFRGLGLNCPGDVGCPGNLMTADVTQTDTPAIAWTDCPDGSTVPASVGCPSYGQTATTWINEHPTAAVAIGGAVLLFFAMSFGGRRR